MKELYTSPEAKLICFAPVENLATFNIDVDNLWRLSGQGGGKVSEIIPDDDDMEFPAVGV